MSIQTIFLSRAYRAAQAAHHIFPAFAACEAALESGWGRSQLAIEANNLFGQKQSHPPLAGTETIAMPTREFLHGHWLTVSANWAKFADWSECFRARMEAAGTAEPGLSALCGGAEVGERRAVRDSSVAELVDGSAAGWQGAGCL